jgi:probable rRNA maturation factor
MKLSIHNQTSYQAPRTYFARILKKAVALFKFEPSELSVAFLGESEMKRINKMYRGADAPTDVLSFSYGEILLCPDYIKKKYKITSSKQYSKQTQLLFAHGILHIAGYDHSTKGDEEMMRALEEKLVKC